MVSSEWIIVIRTLGGGALGGGIDLVRSYALERQRQRADKAIAGSRVAPYAPERP
jgi:hypothetical protein